MGKMIIAFLVALLVLYFGNVYAEGHVNFTGEWQLDQTKTDMSQSRLIMSKINVNQKSDSLLTTRTYETENGEQYPFDEYLTLDGKEYQITIYDMPRTCAANWSDDKEHLLLNSNVTFYGNSGEMKVATKETWSLKENGTILLIEYVSNSTQGERSGSYFYSKIKQ